MFYTLELLHLFRHLWCHPKIAQTSSNEAYSFTKRRENWSIISCKVCHTYILSQTCIILVCASIRIQTEGLKCMLATLGAGF